MCVFVRTCVCKHFHNPPLSRWELCRCSSVGRKNKPLITTQSVSYSFPPPLFSSTPPSHCTAVAALASRLVNAAQASAESLSLLLSLNKQLQLVPVWSKKERAHPWKSSGLLRQTNSQALMGNFCFWNWTHTPTGAAMREEMLWWG